MVYKIDAPSHGLAEISQFCLWCADFLEIAQYFHGVQVVAPGLKGFIDNRWWRFLEFSLERQTTTADFSWYGHIAKESLILQLFVYIHPGDLSIIFLGLLQFILFEDELKLVSEAADGGIVIELISQELP